MANRIVFPIFNENKSHIVGFSCRDSTDKSKLKWIIEGSKKDFCYPSYLSEEHIKKQSELILVESVGDCVALWEAGIKNVLVLFGVFLTSGVFKKLISLNPQKIVIALNNDSAGRSNSTKLNKKLLNFFDSDRICVKLPTSGDFGEMSCEEIQQWKNNL